ncbi:MAG: hypothetical protein KAS12_07230, partial [Candidatus Aenigmarchaeota archaeon]|nr:hypothetical protein [Candidatus Aenigmarchaeota archaeon]
IKTNEELWKLALSETESNVVSSALIVHEKIIFCARDGYIRCINKNNKDLMWKIRTNSTQRMILSGVFSPLNWDLGLLDNVDEEVKEKLRKQQELVERFEPYTFTEIYGLPTKEDISNSNIKEPYLMGENTSVGTYRRTETIDKYSMGKKNSYI